MNEAAVSDLHRYHNLGELFRRQLRPGCRPVDHNCPLVCVFYVIFVIRTGLALNLGKTGFAQPSG